MHNVKFGGNLSICSQDFEGKQNLALKKGHYSDTNVRKMKCNNLKLDLVNMNAYINFGEILAETKFWRK